MSPRYAISPGGISFHSIRDLRASTWKAPPLERVHTHLSLPATGCMLPTLLRRKLVSRTYSSEVTTAFHSQIGPPGCSWLLTLQYLCCSSLYISRKEAFNVVFPIFMSLQNIGLSPAPTSFKSTSFMSIPIFANSLCTQDTLFHTLVIVFLDMYSDGFL